MCVEWIIDHSEKTHLPHHEWHNACITQWYNRKGGIHVHYMMTVQYQYVPHSDMSQYTEPLYTSIYESFQAREKLLMALLRKVIGCKARHHCASWRMFKLHLIYCKQNIQCTIKLHLQRYISSMTADSLAFLW